MMMTEVLPAQRRIAEPVEKVDMQEAAILVDSPQRIFGVSQDSNMPAPRSLCMSKLQIATLLCLGVPPLMFLGGTSTGELPD